MKKIAFIGATGIMGRPVAIELSRAGFDVTALIRDSTKAKKLLPDSIRLIPGNLENTSDLDQLLSGQDALFLNLNLNPKLRQDVFHPEREGLKLIIDIAKKERIKRIGFTSSIIMNYQGMNNFHWWVFDLKHQAVRMIKESGIPYSIFYPSSFFENFISHYRQGNRIILGGKSKFKQWFISGEDYGRQVARSFQLLKNENREYFIQGLEGFTTDEATDVYVKNTKEKLKVLHLPIGLPKFLGLFNSKANYGYHIITALNEYPEQFQAATTWEELGKPHLTLKEFAGSHTPL